MHLDSFFDNAEGWMKVAIIGSGIAGIMAARELHARGHEITLYEASRNIGGHVRTVWLPKGEGDLVPHELGVFMLDPQAIHPNIASLAKALNIEIRSFPLTFTFEYPEEGLSWTTISKLPVPLRNFKIVMSQFFKNLGSRYFYWNSKFFFDLSLIASHF